MTITRDKFLQTKENETLRDLLDTIIPSNKDSLSDPLVKITLQIAKVVLDIQALFSKPLHRSAASGCTLYVALKTLSLLSPGLHVGFAVAFIIAGIVIGVLGFALLLHTTAGYLDGSLVRQLKIYKEASNHASIELVRLQQT